MSWLSNLFKKRRRLTVQEIAYKLANIFSQEIEEIISDKSSNGWIWNSIPQADTRIVVRELAIVDIFLKTLGYIPYTRQPESTRTLLDHFTELVCNDLLVRGILSNEGDIAGLVHDRFEAYYTAIQGSKDISFQIMRIADAFLRNCNSPYSATGLGAVTICFQYRLAAEKYLITSLERDVDIVA